VNPEPDTVQTLEPIADNLWTARAPQTFFGLHIGTQMTVVRLSGDGLLLHSPIAISPGLQQQIDALGPVRHIVCPNLFHHLYGGDAKQRWPQALLHGPEKLQRKRKDLRFDATLSEAPHPDWQGDLQCIHIGGSLLDETVLYHVPSRTLITVDLVENFSHHDHGPTRLYLKLGGIYGRVSWHRLLRLVYVGRRRARADVDRILALPFERVLVAHGDNIEHDAKRVIRDGLSWL
jgi:hypothetical protein